MNTLSANNFPNYPLTSKIWIYQASSELSPEQQSKLKANAAEFVAHWTSHNQKVEAKIELLYNRFLILAVNEQVEAPGGCAIDKAFQFIQYAERELNIRFLDRTLVAYIDPKAENGQEKINTCTMQEFEQLAKIGVLTENTLVFNNMANNLADLGTKWKVPAKNSWHSRYFSS